MPDMLTQPMKPPALPGAGNTMPAAVPTNNLGTKSRVRQGIIALSKAMLELIKQAGPESEEGQVLIAALKATSKIAGDANPEMQKQEMQLLMNRPPSGPPQAGDIKSKLAAMGLGQGAGQGAPPGAGGGPPS